jgi:hypothetical protein
LSGNKVLKDVLNTAKCQGLRENESMGNVFNGGEMGEV